MIRKVTFAVIGLLAICPAFAKIDMGKWEVFSAKELAMTDAPMAPGAKAVYLFRRAEVISGTYTYHAAIKVLNDAGRDCADFEVPESVRKIMARTVKPDGAATEINKDDIMKKIVVKKRGSKSQMKVFTLPEVSPGAIVEVFLQAPLEGIDYYIFTWPFQVDLPCLESYIELSRDDQKIYNTFAVDVYKQTHINRTEEEKGRVRYMAFSVPALPDDDFLPPENFLKVYFLRIIAIQEVENAGKLDLTTKAGQEEYMNLFWSQTGVKASKVFYDFLKSKDKVGKLLETIKAAAPDKADITRAAYDYVTRHIKNTDFVKEGEEERTARAKTKEKEKTNKCVDDVIKNGCGDRSDIMMLYTALLQAAGIEAYPALACGRDDTFFRKSLLLLSQFDQPLTAVKGPTGYAFYDPSTPYCQFGSVAWLKQDTEAIIFSPGGSEILMATPGNPNENRIVRKMEASLDGRTLKAKLQIEYFGNPDFCTRNAWDDETEEERRDFVKSYIEKNFDKAELTAYEFRNLRDVGAPFSITAEFSVPDFATETRSRIIFKPSALGKNQNAFFSNEKRQFPICLDYPFIVKDEFSFQIPPGAVCDQLPAPLGFENSVGRYTLKTAQDGGVLKLQREFCCKGAYYEPQEYALVKGFFQSARKGDETSIVLKRQE